MPRFAVSIHRSLPKLEKKLKLRNLAMMPLCLVLAGSLSAQDRLATKQLSGPIEEVRSGVMARVDPITTAIHSKSAMIPVGLTPSEDGTWRWQGRIAVDEPTLKLMLFSGEESWRLSLLRPDGKALVPAHKLATEVRRSSLEMGNDAFEGDYYELARTPPGEWTVVVEAEAPLDGQGYLLYSSDSDYRLLSYKTTFEQLVGHEIGFVSYGYRKVDEGPQIEANLGMLSGARLQITAPDGRQLTRPMFDDGRHGDGAADDGIFGGSFVAVQEGTYQARVLAEGTTPEGHPFRRTAEHLVPVIAPRLALAREVASARLVDERRLHVSLAVDNHDDGPDKYRVFAEVWGADNHGEMQPVNWIGGMSYVDQGQLTLGLDVRWLGLSPANHDFELRNVRIEDPNTFIAVAKIPAMPLRTPSLPAEARAVPEVMDAEMFVGPRPARASADKAGGRLLLVHGYCSGNVWGPVSGQFSNASIFLDTDKNRSHDAFANLIAGFGSSYSSYGIVAHSQGGAASLHLYTYYWSGLDYATGGRLIQSVGTPYQGTSLAGNAAVLGQIFGVGCGTNTDLTYSGAASWLSGVPTWARNAVNYYTTSFKDYWWSYDYCHLVTDLLLNDPDDGTTEKAKGQLSSGVNRGHRTGWCHTSGMADPAQTTDSSRNASMSSNAAN